MTTLTRWLLRLFADQWPGGLDSDSLYLEDRDDSMVLDVDTGTDPTTLARTRPTESFDLTTGNTLGVALTGDDQTPAGLGGREYRAEPVLSVRIEGASVYEHGHIEHAEAFTNLVRTAGDIVREVENGDLVKAPVADWHVAEPANPNPGMVDQGEYFTWSFEVQPRGYRTV